MNIVFRDTLQIDLSWMRSNITTPTTASRTVGDCFGVYFQVPAGEIRSEPPD